jgi:cysteinyl-tRNA synthetase
MALHLFNTLTRSLQTFTPLDPAGKSVGMYCCGPTVYDFGHIGNFRTFVFADLVRRYLEFKGYAVRHVMNITDVEDKIIRRVRETGKSLQDYTGEFESAFWADHAALNCLRPHATPHATEYIGEIIALIEILMARGVAYRTDDGSVYFSIEKYRGRGGHYGRLLKLNFDALRVGERIKNDEYAKESVADFALWKARAPEDGAVCWPSPWGEGRPGWHIECSAMSMKLLGASFDLHLGGEDLIFPHHEDEIAQSEGAGVQASGQPFVKHWLHGAHLLAEGKKMSKSLGNFYTLRDLLAKGFTGREIRYLLLTAHYREPFNFTLDGLQAARTALGRLDECKRRLTEIAAGATGKVSAATISEGQRILGEFTAAMDDDLNVSKAWAVIFEEVRVMNAFMAAGKIEPNVAAHRLTICDRMFGCFGLTPPPAAEAPAEIAALAEARLAARQARDFKRADAIRDEMKAQGWIIEDTPKGPRLKRA